MKFIFFTLAFLVSSLSFSTQLLDENSFLSKQTYLVILAHPDDETWMNGTLALLTLKKKNINVIYATSGGEGNDYSGQNLSGDALALTREKESITALKQLGIKKPPIFLRHQDKKLSLDRHELLNNLLSSINKLKPDVVFTFEPHGITGHKDHKLVHELTRTALNAATKPFQVIEFAVSHKRAKVLEQLAKTLHNPYRIKHSYPDENILLNVHVKKTKHQRVKAFESYPTQFPPSLQELWKQFVAQAPYEEFISSE